MKLKIADKYKGTGVSSRLRIMNFFFFNKLKPNSRCWKLGSKNCFSCKNTERWDKKFCWNIMNLRDESKPPHQERAGTGIFALCEPSQVVAQGFALSFLLIMDRVEQESLGTPAAGRGTNLPCSSAVLWTEPTGPAGTQTWLLVAHGWHLATPPVQQYQGTCGCHGHKQYIPKRHTNPPFLPPNHPDTAEPHLRLRSPWASKCNPNSDLHD